MSIGHRGAASHSVILGTGRQALGCVTSCEDMQPCLGIPTFPVPVGSALRQGKKRHRCLAQAGMLVGTPTDPHEPPHPAHQPSPSSGRWDMGTRFCSTTSGPVCYSHPAQHTCVCLGHTCVHSSSLRAHAPNTPHTGHTHGAGCAAPQPLTRSRNQGPWCWSPVRHSWHPGCARNQTQPWRTNQNDDYFLKFFFPLGNQDYPQGRAVDHLVPVVTGGMG